MSNKTLDRRDKVLQDCILILLDVENSNLKNGESKIEANAFFETIKARYGRYKERKERENEKGLSFYDFVSLNAIRAEQKAQKCFLFGHPKTAFELMISESAQSVIKYKKFEEWAPQLYPLATKYNVERVFVALSRPDGETSLNKKQGLPNDKNSKLMFESIHFDTFLQFVRELKNEFILEELQCAGVKNNLKDYISKHERILYHQKGVTDNTGLPPHYGFVLLTDYNLLFHGSAAIIDRTICCQLSKTKKVDRARIGTLLRRDTALSVVSDHGTYTWNIISVKSDTREKLFWSIYTMLNAHKLISKNEITDKKIRLKIIREAADDVLRQNALQTMIQSNDNNINNSSFDTVAFLRFAKEEERQAYIEDIKNEILHIENKSGNMDGWTSYFSKPFGMNKTKNDTIKTMIDDRLIDPSINYTFVQELENERGVLDHYDNPNFKMKEEFDIKVFIKYFKQLQTELEPLFMFIKFYQCIIKWKNPGLSFAIFIFLQLIAWFDRIVYIPCLLFVFNAFYMIMMRKDPKKANELVSKALLYCGYEQLNSGNNSSNLAEDTSSSNNESNNDDNNNGSKNRNENNNTNGNNGGNSMNKDDNSRKDSSGNGECVNDGKNIDQLSMEKEREKENESDKEENENESGFFSRVRKLRNRVETTRDSLSAIQTTLKEQTVKLGKIRTIYFWKMEGKSQIICIVSLIAAALILIVPFNMLFSLVVFSRFFKFSPLRPKRERRRDFIDKFWEDIEADIPNVEENKEKEKDKDKEKEKERENDENEKAKQSKQSKTLKTTKTDNDDKDGNNSDSNINQSQSGNVTPKKKDDSLSNSLSGYNSAPNNTVDKPVSKPKNEDTIFQMSKGFGQRIRNRIRNYDS